MSMPRVTPVENHLSEPGHTLGNEKPGKAGPYRAKLKDYRSLFVAIDFLTAFMTLLGLDGQRRNRTCIQTL